MGCFQCSFFVILFSFLSDVNILTEMDNGRERYREIQSEEIQSESERDTE